MKAVLFDLDGVLIDAKEIHYEALNDALGEYAISRTEHINVYDGKPTRTKLNMLSQLKGLPVSEHNAVYEKKQARTLEMISELKPVKHLVELFAALKDRGLLIGVCSNSIRKTTYTALSKTGLMDHCDLVVSNQDVRNPKPHPEMYWKAMAVMGVSPGDALIVEDSPTGLASAYASGANVMRVRDIHDTNLENVMKHMKEKGQQSKWEGYMNVLIPMAGAGSRFEKAGYTFPKPLIDVNGKPMIQVVVDNLGIDAQYIFVVQKSHRERYNLDSVLNIIAPGCIVVETDTVTEGAACTALLAKDYIDNNTPLFFANSDQYVEWDNLDFFYTMQERGCDGGILTFQSTHPKWSYAEVDENGCVVRVAEKEPISDNATCGLYYWRRGADFVHYAEQMISRDVRVNGEFYVCPVFNQAIADGKVIRTVEASAMHGLGTPEDLERFMRL
jgi:HAD superfamily hydrolase (TIGR01509 family)